MVAGLAFVEGETFEDEGGELLGGFVVEFDETGGGAESIGLGVFKTGGHDAMAVSLGQKPVDVEPLPAGPALGIIIRAEHGDDEI